ncbi:ATP-binding protein [Geoalkalibacter sp.]|uniref:ATP-binding protein n=1 Tax=Geoalkalibacter sp. TaxID=3041440 RepID=UPI00272E1238|nr:ATP-binding protein [Geoalkalibacter sp.]
MAQSPHYAIKGLRKKIILSAIVYTLAALLIISILSIYPFYHWIRHFEENGLTHAAKIRALAIEEYLSRMVEITRQINARSAIRRALQDYRDGRLSFEELQGLTPAVLTDALEISREVVGITRLDAQLRVVAQVGQPIPRQGLPSSPMDIAYRIFDPLLIDGSLYLAVCGPILHKNQPTTVIGYDLVLFSTNQLQRIIWDETGLGASGESFLARGEGDETVLFFPSRKGSEEVYNLRLARSSLQPAVDQAGRGELGILRLEEASRGKVVAFAPISGTPWALLVAMDQAELMAPLQKQVFSVAALVLFFTTLGTLGLLALLRPLTGRVLVHTEELDELNRSLREEINERQRAEEDLRRSEHEWEMTFEAITDAVAIMDREKRIHKLNRAATDLARELFPALPTDEGCRRLFGLDKPPEDCPFCRMAAEKQAQCAELHEASGNRWFHVASYPLFDEGGELWGGVLIAQDFTEQKRMEQIKDEMISSVSHEMRTPLTAMLGFVEFMLENPVEREQQIDYLKTVHHETERLNELISNFLDLQRLQAQLETYHFAAVDPCVLLGQAAHLFQVASKKHRVLLRCPEKLPTIRGDENRLMQVLKNLVSNAIKYSPEGGDVVLGAKAEGDEVLLFVQDQGLGIPSHARDRIFERFYRVDDSEKRLPGGIGLGLALVREVIRAHGGRVWVESTIGVGSTFYVSLPVNKTE